MFLLKAQQGLQLYILYILFFSGIRTFHTKDHFVEISLILHILRSRLIFFTGLIYKLTRNIMNINSDKCKNLTV